MNESKSSGSAVTNEGLLQYQRALASFSRVASEAISPERLAQHACAQISSVTRIRHVKVLKYRPDAGDLLVVAGVGWKPGVVGTATFPIDRSSPPGRSIQTAAPVVSEDLPNDPEFTISPVLAAHGIVSLLNVPVMIDGKNWGVLEVDSEAKRHFGESDIGFLTAFANMTGAALARYDADQKALAAAQAQVEADVLWKARVRELQHRVKNNLQTVVSFLSQQRRQTSSPETRIGLASLMDRVQAIALAHDQLSHREGASQVEFADYLHSLCANIDPHRETVSVQVDADEALIPLDRAVPAGLIINELVTNAFKYAFDEAESGSVRIEFRTNQERGEGCIVVEDNGKGMEHSSSGGVGIKLVNAFAQQLGARPEYETNSSGTRWRICFPLVI
ncbi:histidine kinase dimerization/phosphoacceptor domain -containing protein [Chelatococcus reniformis]|uniref:histidine kinase n=1 Tax=Chelatococcus reniformis TaxID=1494448 RepID=A0A916TX12_9HYPH|nr:histidine kinase dimerization/phosphoacceptor domain -containing protein [Chelatococcus reniformis]GGC47673.1 histidine kinase [Chelatococcus reniformis]